MKPENSMETLEASTTAGATSSVATGAAASTTGSFFLEAEAFSAFSALGLAAAGEAAADLAAAGVDLEVLVVLVWAGAVSVLEVFPGIFLYSTIIRFI